MPEFHMKLPELGEGIFEGEILTWFINEGDQIEEDDSIAEVQNDKAVTELPSPVSGKVIELKVKAGEVCTVEDVILVVDVEGSDVDTDDAQDEASVDNIQEASGEVNEESVQASMSQSNDTRDASENRSEKFRVKATPSIRKLAREMDVSLIDIIPTGKNERITRDDVMSFNKDNEQVSVEATSSMKENTTRVNTEELEVREPIQGIRKVISNAMVKSKFTAPHVTIMDEVNVEKLVTLREQVKSLGAEKSIKVSYLPFITKALIAGLKEFPILNSSVDDHTEELIYKNYYNIGIATDTDKGLLVPVINSADQKNIWNIAKEITDLSNRARESKLSSDELSGSTMTITNIGSLGGMFFTPIINHPEAAILGVGRIEDKPIVVNKEVVSASIMSLSLSFDHRIIDGSTAQNFINYVKRLLENPQFLVMEI